MRFHALSCQVKQPRWAMTSINTLSAWLQQYQSLWLLIKIDPGFRFFFASWSILSHIAITNVPDSLQAHMSEFKDGSAKKVPWCLAYICETTQKKNKKYLVMVQEALDSKWGVSGAGQGFDIGDSPPSSLSFHIYRDLDGSMHLGLFKDSLY